MVLCNDLMHEWLDNYTENSDLINKVEMVFAQGNKGVLKPTLLTRDGYLIWTGANGEIVGNDVLRSTRTEIERNINTWVWQANEIDISGYLPVDLTDKIHGDMAIYLYKQIKKAIKRQYPQVRFRLVFQGEVDGASHKLGFKLWFAECGSEIIELKFIKDYYEYYNILDRAEIGILVETF